jgi:hypothetical protein
LFAGIVKDDFKFVSHMSMSIIGKTNTAGLRDGFETDSHIDYVAKYIAGILDNIADIDADPEFNALIRWYGRVAFGHAVLNIDRATSRIHNAVELSQESIAGILYNGPTMGSNLRGKQRVQMFPQPYMRAFFVCAGQSAVTNSVGCKDGNEPSQ